MTDAQQVVVRKFVKTILSSLGRMMPSQRTALPAAISGLGVGKAEQAADDDFGPVARSCYQVT